MFPQINSLKGKRKKLITEAEIKQVIEDSMRKTAKEAKDLFDEVQSTWSHKFTVEETDISWGADAKMRVFTDDEIFWYLDTGVPKHVKMDKSFVPKTYATKPATFKSTAGGGIRTPVRKYKHKVGDIESREWTKTMAVILEKVLIDTLNKEIRKAIA